MLLAAALLLFIAVQLSASWALWLVLLALALGLAYLGYFVTTVSTKVVIDLNEDGHLEYRRLITGPGADRVSRDLKDVVEGSLEIDWPGPWFIGTPISWLADLKGGGWLSTSVRYLMAGHLAFKPKGQDTAAFTLPYVPNPVETRGWIQACWKVIEAAKKEAAQEEEGSHEASLIAEALRDVLAAPLQNVANALQARSAGGWNGE